MCLQECMGVEEVGWVEDGRRVESAAKEVVHPSSTSPHLLHEGGANLLLTCCKQVVPPSSPPPPHPLTILTCCKK